jgi:hypothetical protein
MDDRKKNEHGGYLLPVHIRNFDDIDNEVVNVRSDKNDEVEWISDGDPFTIQFTNGPFQQDRFDVPAGGRVTSGPASTSKHGYYQYFITNVALAMSADPGVNIKP